MEASEKRANTWIFLESRKIVELEGKIVELEGNSKASCSWNTWNSPQEPWKDTAWTGRIRRRIKNILTTALLKSARIMVTSNFRLFRRQHFGEKLTKSKIIINLIFGEECSIFANASHQTQARRPIKVGIKGRERSGTSRDSNPTMLLIGSLGAMWAWWGKQFHEPNCVSGHVCQFTA